MVVFNPLIHFLTMFNINIELLAHFSPGAKEGIIPISIKFTKGYFFSIMKGNNTLLSQHCQEMSCKEPTVLPESHDLDLGLGKLICKRIPDAALPT